ncbi:diguanylate cyclase [Rhodovulum sp. PH10]|uniref:bifunctional diguanylate cyclase/phosphodiesterase n=1 Tax=Rhodovulum sp. PH10 TaxID=1187851 RepID=UPI00027C25D1|nr:EAL domain-containing protein [Rhodovulum sp. PH10]EJW13406.1 diguanylate cyclase [Rhodovulum sp. PH10]
MDLRKKLLPFQALIVVAGLMVGLSALAIGVTVAALRTDAIRATERESENTARFVADQIATLVRPLERLLTELGDVVPQLGVTTPAEFERTFAVGPIADLLEDRMLHVPQAIGIRLFAPDGRLLVAAERDGGEAPRTDDYQFFRQLGIAGENGLYVSPPILTARPKQWRVYLGRRIVGTSGTFVGIVAVAVPVAYFDQIYATYSRFGDRAFVIARRDGTILATNAESVSLTGRRIPGSSAWYDVVRAGGGPFRSPGFFDGVPRIAAAASVPGLPLVVSTAVPRADALARWHQHAIRIGAGTAVAALCAFLLLAGVYHQFRRLVASEASLAEGKADLKEKSRELERANMRLDAALNNMSHGLCMFDRTGRLLVCNDRYLRMYRLGREMAQPGTTLEELMRRRIAVGTYSGDPLGYVAELRRLGTGARQTHFTTELADGRIIAVLNDRMSDGGWVAVHEDITERTRAEQRIAHMARHDALTDLANRTLAAERMDEALERMAASGHGFAVFIFDIDLFKSVNDSLGHGGGDALLRAVAQRLRGCIDDGDTAGRIGGDEFAVVQGNSADPQAAAAALSARLLDVVQAPYEIDGQRVVIGISIGVALAPVNGTEPSQILRNADLALYRAKSDGRGCSRFFEPEMDADARLHRAFEFELREALVREEFEIHYQPIVDIATRKACAVEALVRWRHPRHGLISPDKFIPVAEEIGLIVPLGEWILQTACETAAAWPETVRLAVNLSAVQVRSGGLVETVRTALAHSGLPAPRLELEITESVLLQKDRGGLAVLHDLAALGVHIVLDDFGTGYSSLSYLQMFPFSKIKIDKSFVAELSSRADCAAIVCTVMNLAKALDMATTAEGVETVEQVTLLRAAGCREAQGWLFGRPVPADRLVLDARLGTTSAAA